MKNKLTSTLILAALSALGTSQLMAQTVPTVEIKVPFEFIAGNHVLPAGTYAIHANLAQRAVTIQGIDHKVSTLVLARREDGRVATQTSLTFHRYGTRNFLYRVSAEGSPAVATVLGSKQEKEEQLAHATPTIVNLVAQR